MALANMRPFDVSLPFVVSGELKALFGAAPSVVIASTIRELDALAVRDARGGVHEVGYAIPGKKAYHVEANVCRVKNGVAANYTEAYMRRRDPDCMYIADALPTDKPRFSDSFGYEFTDLRRKTFDWLASQPLVAFAFYAGGRQKGYPSLVIVPENAAFFALGLALLQGIVPVSELEPSFTPRAIVFVAPPFRHTHFGGRQVVVHHRTETCHELFSYNLYPGPSAKKGVYGVLLNQGEQEDWVTIHCSTVQVTTPYENRVVFVHEGASGGGKSEMLEAIHREKDGSVLVGTNTTNGDTRHITLPRGCELRPVTDDMAMCHPTYDRGQGTLTVADAEHAWFVRVNHIKNYGTDPALEHLTIHNGAPQLFLNIEARPGSTALIWEHVQDGPGRACPNPRIVIPRSSVPNIVDHPVDVDIRSFGVRCPPCTRLAPTYGILGLFHVLPPALAWLWRLVAPRGHDNPSIVDSEGLSSEGVGSYWPFATGRRVVQANLLLNQVLSTPEVQYVLIPNQHIGAWRTGFSPQWLTREYLARRNGSRFGASQVEESSCSLLGYTPRRVVLEGQTIPPWLLDVSLQREVGQEGFAAGARELEDFFKRELPQYLESDLLDLGKRIIECCLQGARVSDYRRLIDHGTLASE